MINATRMSRYAFSKRNLLQGNIYPELWIYFVIQVEFFYLKNRHSWIIISNSHITSYFILHLSILVNFISIFIETGVKFQSMIVFQGTPLNGFFWSFTMVDWIGISDTLIRSWLWQQILFFSAFLSIILYKTEIRKTISILKLRQKTLCF